MFIDLMNRLSKPCLDRLVMVFVDNILAYFEAQRELSTHLRIILQILRDHQLYAKKEWPKSNSWNMWFLKKEY